MALSFRRRATVAPSKTRDGSSRADAETRPLTEADEERWDGGALGHGLRTAADEDEDDEDDDVALRHYSVPSVASLLAKWEAQGHAARR